jgi:hypothetical protein
MGQQHRHEMAPDPGVLVNKGNQLCSFFFRPRSNLFSLNYLCSSIQWLRDDKILVTISAEE